MVRVRALALLAVAVAALAVAPAANAAHKRIRLQNVCFTVTNPAGSKSILYGQRFAYGKVKKRATAIVLVHGIASSTENWDFTPKWSVARSLARRGYMVFSYDRLGYAKSSYFSQPGGGYSLTTQAHRAELHEVVDQVKRGVYATTKASDCAGAKRRSHSRKRSVVIIGHSAGGWVVSGYPGTYHDVRAMIQADIPASQAPGSGAGGGFDPDVPAHPDYFQFFHTRQDCETFNTYPPGVVQSVVNKACTPPFLDSPFGEIADLGAKIAQNQAAIKQIGPKIPVLLTSGDHDTTDPPATANEDWQYYKANCGCDVKQILLPNTGHLFMVHKSLKIWTHDVVLWLHHRKIR